MAYKDQQPTLMGFMCSPFVDKITRKPLFGSPYARAVDILGVEAQLYSIGAALGHALRNKLDTLVKLLFVPGTEKQKVNEVLRLCKNDVEKNLEEFRDEFGQQPDTFDDFAFYRGIGHVLKAEGIRLSPREAFEAYLSGDKKVRRLFDTKVNTAGIGQRIMVLLLQGIHFGSIFSELTEKMYQNAYKDDKNFWAGRWAQGLTVPEELKVKSLEETERAVLQIVAVYASKYYPELIDPLGLMGFLQPSKSREQK